MKPVRRKSIGTHFSMCVQPAFIIGTNNEDGVHNVAPMIWASAASEKAEGYINHQHVRHEKNRAECDQNRCFMR